MISRGLTASSLWVMLTPNKTTATPPQWHTEAKKLTPPANDSDRYLWTDLKNNLFDVMILGH
jgi:hypothetical protein